MAEDRSHPTQGGPTGNQAQTLVSADRRARSATAEGGVRQRVMPGEWLNAMGFRFKTGTSCEMQNGTLINDH